MKVQQIARIAHPWSMSPLDGGAKVSCFMFHEDYSSNVPVGACEVHSGYRCIRGIGAFGVFLLQSHVQNVMCHGVKRVGMSFLCQRGLDGASCIKDWLARNAWLESPQCPCRFFRKWIWCGIVNLSERSLSMMWVGIIVELSLVLKY